MAAAFTAAAIFDAIALIVVTIAIRMRQAGAHVGQPESARADELTTEMLEAELLEAEVI
jgi:hypothetical protein